MSGGQLRLSSRRRERMGSGKLAVGMTGRPVHGVEIPAIVKTAGFDCLLTDLEHSDFSPAIGQAFDRALRDPAGRRGPCFQLPREDACRVRGAWTRPMNAAQRLDDEIDEKGLPAVRLRSAQCMHPATRSAGRSLSRSHMIAPRQFVSPAMLLSFSAPIFWTDGDREWSSDAPTLRVATDARPAPAGRHGSRGAPQCPRTPVPWPA